MLSCSHAFGRKSNGGNMPSGASGMSGVGNRSNRGVCGVGGKDDDDGDRYVRTNGGGRSLYRGRGCNGCGDGGGVGGSAIVTNRSQFPVARNMVRCYYWRCMISGLEIMIRTRYRQNFGVKISISMIYASNCRSIAESARSKAGVVERQDEVF
jgi:hypothetical protein